MMKLVNVSEISSTAPVRAGKDQVLFDSGANCCVTNQREDFVGECKRADRPQIYSERVRKLSGLNHTKLEQDGGNYVRGQVRPPSRLA